MGTSGKMGDQLLSSVGGEGTGRGEVVAEEGLLGFVWPATQVKWLMESFVHQGPFVLSEIQKQL